MRQLLHIFKKDIRGLWGELAVFLCCLVLASLSFLPSTLSGSYTELEGEALSLIAGCYLIARLIHAETIPGSTHFWLARPYRWPALLGAKALFIFVSVHLPVFIAQAVLLRNAGFPVWGNLPALLWMQVLVLACVSLPAAAIAAVTTGLAGFSLFVVGGLASGVAVLFFRDYGASGGRRFLSDEVWVPSHVGWVSYAILAVAMTAAALPVLLAQYSRRRTPLSRALLGGILLGGLGLSLFAGHGLSWTIQALASTRTWDTTSFQFSLGTPTWMAATTLRRAQPPEHIAGWPPASFEGTYVDINVPLLIKGMDPGSDVEPENVFLSFEAADGEISSVWMRPLWAQIQQQGGVPNPFHRSRMWLTSGGERRLDLSLNVAGKFYEKLRNKPSIARGYIDLFAIGNERTLATPRTAFPVNVTSAFRCGLENLHPEKPLSRGLKCRAAFRWPFQSIEVAGGLFVSPESFSPFPATLRLNPIEERQLVFDLQESPQVDFNLREPVSFVRKEFEIHGVQLIEGPATQRGWGIEQ